MQVLRRYWLTITFAILLFLLVQNLSIVFLAAQSVYGVISPIFIGFCLAFVMDIPVSFFEKHFKSVPQKYRRTAAIAAAYVLAAGIFALMLLFILPSIIDSVVKIVGNSTVYFNNISKAITEFYQKFNIENDFLVQLQEGLKNALVSITQFTVDTSYKLITFTFTFAGNLFKWLLAIFFSIYMVAARDQLTLSCSRFTYAVFNFKTANYLERVAARSSQFFKNFVASEIIVAAILGIICFIGMSIFNFPFAHLISAIIAITALIPYVGGFIGPIPSVVLIMLVDMNSAIGFAVFIAVLNLVSGNIIVPKVMGDSLGLDAFWVLVAITIGGGLFGVAGMLFGVPIFAVIRSFVSEIIDARLEERLDPTDISLLNS